MGIERVVTSVAICDECNKTEEIGVQRMPKGWRFVVDSPFFGVGGAAETLICSKECGTIWAVRYITKMFDEEPNYG